MDLRMLYDEDLTDRAGLDGTGTTVQQLDGSGSYTVSLSGLMAELEADLGAGSFGSGATGFRLTAENLAAQIHQDMDSTSQVPLTATDTAAQHRRVIRRALVEHGYLSTKWRFITLPLKPKKSARIT